MAETKKSFEQISAEVARHTDFSLGEGEKAAQLCNLLAAVSREGHESAKLRAFAKIPSLAVVLSAAAAVLLIISVGVFVLHSKEDEEIPFWVGRLPVKGELNLSVMSAASETIPIQFEGGSRIGLGENSEAKVRQSEKERVVVDLKRGSLSADIRKRNTEWIIVGGAYQVKVWGTAFTVNWLPESEAIDVTVERGIVSVHGPGMSDAGVRLEAGERFHRAPNDRTDEKEVSSDAARAEETDAEESDCDEDATLESLRETTPILRAVRRERSGGAALAESAHGEEHPKTTDPSAPLPKWRASLAEGQFEQAVKEAEASGIQNIIATEKVESLWQLADAARYAERKEVAEVLLRAVRKKAPDSKPAGSASFVLGKLALDRKDLDDAARWFASYLEESANRPMAEEALGRLVWIYQRSGNILKAKEAARQYLSRYPDGPFDHVARAVLDGEDKESE